MVVFSGFWQQKFGDIQPEGMNQCSQRRESKLRRVEQIVKNYKKVIWRKTREASDKACNAAER